MRECDGLDLRKGCLDLRKGCLDVYMIYSLFKILKLIKEISFLYFINLGSRRSSLSLIHILILFDSYS